MEAQFSEGAPQRISLISYFFLRNEIRAFLSQSLWFVCRRPP